MNKLLLGVAAFAFLPNATSQEMFNNGSFEDYYDCPTSTGQTIQIIGRVGSNDTPDYYNCSFNPSSANTGTGSVYLGAIRDNTTGQDVAEGITLELTTPLELGKTYDVSIAANYGVTVYGDPNFDYTEYLDCYRLKFVFCFDNQSGDPSAPHQSFDPQAVVGNDNDEYEDFNFQFTADQAYTHVYILTGASTTNESSSPNPDCISSGSTAYVFYNIIDDLSITEVISTASVNKEIFEQTELYPNPSEGLFNLSGLEALKGEELIVYSTQGQILKRVKVETAQMSLDLRNLEKGMYFLGTSKSALKRQIIIK